jgi:DNA-binding beta-propeller fold protein YncE
VGFGAPARTGGFAIPHDGTSPTPWLALSASADGSRVAVTTRDGGELAYLDGSSGAAVWNKAGLGPVPPDWFNDGTHVSIDGTKVYVVHGYVTDGRVLDAYRVQ